MSSKEFPSNSDYTTIVKNLDAFVSDATIVNGEPFYTKTNRLISYAGGYSKVFPIKVNNTKKALRFWTANIEDSQKRYQEIDLYLKQKKLPYFVGFDYHHGQLNWKKTSYPFVSMDWVEGLTLNKYIDKNINDSSKIKELANSFLEMVEVLHQNEIAHGDLQDGNILIIEQSNQIKLKLIDYDSLYVPDLRNSSIEIIGVESYQHPKKNDKKQLNEKIDYFSELVIYLSLLAYSEDPNLWIKDQDQKLLFDARDFRDTTKSPIFNALKNGKYTDKVLELTNKLEEFCHENSIDDLTPLEDNLKDKFKDLSSFFEQINSEKTNTSKQIIDEDSFNKKREQIGDVMENAPKKERADMSIVNSKFDELKNKM